VNNSNKQQSAVQPKKHFSRKKWLIISVVIVVLFVGGAISGWLFISRKATPAAPQVTTDATQVVSTKTDQTLSDAQQLAYSGKSSDAQTLYDNALKTTDDPYQKGVLLMGKAVLLFRQAKYDEALAVALDAEAASQSASTAQFIAQIYKKKSDTNNAIAYYQKAISLIDKTSPLADSDAQYYQAEITALGGAKK
jgi:tetratricopeptide (TPR) repeat protein